MLCLIMAGGRGKRLGYVAKPLLKLCNKPLIEWVVKIAKEVCNFIILAISKYTIETSYVCRASYAIECIETSSRGYVEDISTLLNSLARYPILVLPSDILIESTEILKEFIKQAQQQNVDIVNLAILKRNREELTGIAFFRSRQGSWINIVMDSNIIDIDTHTDLEEAREWCKHIESSWR